MSNEPQLGESLGACPALSEYLRASQEEVRGIYHPSGTFLPFWASSLATKTPRHAGIG